MEPLYYMHRGRGVGVGEGCRAVLLAFSTVLEMKGIEEHRDI